VTTGNNGEYTATNLPAGTYTVTVRGTGFQTWTSKDVGLNVSEKRSLDVQLTIGKVAETVEVSSTTTPVETTTAEQSQTITGTQVRELELNNRNFEQLLTLQPGVSANWGDEVGLVLPTVPWWPSTALASMPITGPWMAPISTTAVRMPPF